MMEGLEELLLKLGDISNIEAEVKKSMDECGEFIRDDARLRIQPDTGDLRKSIDHSTEKEGDEIVTTVFTDSDHALFVELGTGPVGAANHAGTSPNVDVSYSSEKWLGKIPFLVSDTDSGLRYIAGQPAQPYMYPALKDNEDQIEEKLKADIKKALEEKS